LGLSYFPAGLREGGERGLGGRVAVGVDAWERTLQGGGGYTERYLTTYGRIAALYRFPEASIPAATQLEFGLKVPGVTSEEIDLSAHGFVETVRLHPKGRSSLYSIASFRVNEYLGFRVRYDNYNFSPSDAETVSNVDGHDYAIHQPRSDMRRIGLDFILSL